METANSDRERFARMAEEYDRMAPYLLPQYAFLQEEMLRQTNLAALAHPRIVDLGAGSGIFLEKVLERNAQALCWWVDASPDFLTVARRRLERFADRVRFVVSPLEEPWEQQVDLPVDCIFSMSAIHHLEREAKRSLYQRCFDCLRTGGWFINTDEMKALFADAYLASLRHWADHVDASGKTIPGELRDHYERWQGHFARWKQRNIENVDRPKTRGDDLHEVFTVQVQWLRDVGFVDADAFVKYHLWCSIGGRKPA
jgi:SAM-dependent methyltransferase